MLPLLVTLQTFVVQTRHRLSREETGATAVEYGLIVGLVAVAIITVLAILGPQIAGMFGALSTKVATIPGGAVPAPAGAGN
jgi:pilus assembly protein Flp/PilA